MIILFDIGGTKTRIAGSRDGKTFSEPHIFPTPAQYDEAMSVISSRALDIAAGERIEGVYGGLRAYERHTGRMREHPTFPLWAGQDVRSSFERAFSSPVFIENDSAVVALGEARFGAGKGKRIVAYLTISTGVGGARIVDGVIDANVYGFEPGHQLIDGVHTLEELVSGAAVSKKYDRPPQAIGDIAIWNDLARFLAIGITNTIVHWSPDVVVVGGSMMNTIGIPLHKVREYVASMLKVFPTVPIIEHATLGDLGGLHGALALANQHS